MFVYVFSKYDVAHSISRYLEPEALIILRQTAKRVKNMLDADFWTHYLTAVYNMTTPLEENKYWACSHYWAVALPDCDVCRNRSSGKICKEHVTSRRHARTYNGMKAFDWALHTNWSYEDIFRYSAGEIWLEDAPRMDRLHWNFKCVECCRDTPSKDCPFVMCGNCCRCAFCPRHSKAPSS